jgi:hypothetical protein
MKNKILILPPLRGGPLLLPQAGEGEVSRIEIQGEN